MKQTLGISNKSSAHAQGRQRKIEGSAKMDGAREVLDDKGEAAAQSRPARRGRKIRAFSPEARAPPSLYVASVSLYLGKGSA